MLDHPYDTSQAKQKEEKKETHTHTHTHTHKEKIYTQMEGYISVFVLADRGKCTSESDQYLQCRHFQWNRKHESEEQGSHLHHFGQSCLFASDAELYPSGP